MSFDPGLSFGPPNASRESRMDEDLIDMVFRAKFYDPAYTHYGNNSRTNVVCDKCRRSNLQYAMGHLNQDLCLTCYDTIRTRISNEYGITPPSSYNRQTQSEGYYQSSASSTQPIARMAISDLRTNMQVRNVNNRDPLDITLMETSSLRRNYDNERQTKMKTSNLNRDYDEEPLAYMAVSNINKNIPTSRRK